MAVLQPVKSVVAAVVAWEVCRVVGLPQAYLAPWTAMLTVQPTVYQSFRASVQQTGASAVGVLVALVVGQWVGVSTLGLGVALALALAIASWRPLSRERATAATTVLFVIALGYFTKEQLLLFRLVDVVIGAAVGMLVNLVFVPPLRWQSARHQIESIRVQLADVLDAVATKLRDSWDGGDVERWLRTLRELDEQIEDAWSALHLARESAWGNPRRRLRRPSRPPDRISRWELTALEHCVVESRGVTRTLYEEGTTDPDASVLLREENATGLAEGVAALAAAVRSGPDGVGATATANRLVREAERRAREQASPAVVSVWMNLRNAAHELATPGAATQRLSTPPGRDRR